MMRLAPFVLFVFIISCSNRTGIPKDILPPDSMELVMKDILMASQYSAQYVSKDSLRPDKRKANQQLMEDIFKIHHITRETFKQSLQFYESRPDLNKKIFDSLSAYVSLHQKDLYAPSSKPIVVPGTPGKINMKPHPPVPVPHKQGANGHLPGISPSHVPPHKDSTSAHHK
jgi:Domain of unknown function (DUF4296)